MADLRRPPSESESGDDDEIDQLHCCDLVPSSREIQNTCVLVTGFGPFAGHEVNASWEAVKELQKLGVAHGVALVAAELPVSYDAVSRLVPRLWQEHHPQLVVHVGVSGLAKDITLETQAFNEGYHKADVYGRLPAGACCCAGSEPCLRTNIDMRTVCEDVNKSHCLAGFVTSDDPGRYLCDFTFYTSLHINSSCTAFVHVPPLDSPYTAQELAHGLQVAVRCMLKQLGLYRQPPLPAGCTLPDYAAYIDEVLREESGQLETTKQ